MKALAGSLILIVIFSCGFAEAEQSQGGNIPSNVFGSVAQGTPVDNVIPLSISEAIDRALKYNLGMIVSEQETRVSRAARLRALSDLLPSVTGEFTESIQQINLAAFGLSGSSSIPSVVGPFSLFDARARYSQPLVDFELRHKLKEASEKLNASNYSQQDVREVVVLIATDLYLEAVAASSRLDAVRAQVRTGQAVYNRAVNLKESGVVPGIDVLRAQVQLQTQQQRVVAAENELAKRKLDLARAIGLPQGQEFSQTDTFTVAPTDLPSFDQVLSSALEVRPDYRHAIALVRAGEESRKAAIGRNRPSISLDADYGDIGRTVGQSHGTMGVRANLLIPIYSGDRLRADLLEDDALLEQRKAEAANLRDRIEYEIRSARLDIQSAAAQLRVAQGTKDLAQQQLTQAQDRFAAGVANSLEVVQAQEATATADESYISSLFALNVAQASLAKAMGAAEKTIKSFFGGK
jgi:outer membrane protein TolC